MAKDNERNKRRKRSHNPKRNINKKYDLTDQELAEELMNDELEQNEQVERDTEKLEMDPDNLFTPSEVEEELADELATDDIEQDDDLSEGNLGLPETDNQDLLLEENDEEIAKEFAELAVEEEDEENNKKET